MSEERGFAQTLQETGYPGLRLYPDNPSRQVICSACFCLMLTQIWEQLSLLATCPSKKRVFHFPGEPCGKGGGGTAAFEVTGSNGEPHAHHEGTKPSGMESSVPPCTPRPTLTPARSRVPAALHCPCRRACQRCHCMCFVLLFKHVKADCFPPMALRCGWIVFAKTSPIHSFNLKQTLPTESFPPELTAKL